MTRGGGCGAAFVVAAVALSAGVARAEDPAWVAGDFPMRLAERPLTLRRGIVAPAADVVMRRVDDGDILTTSIMALSISGGVMDDFEVGGVVAPVQVAPSLSYRDPSVYGRLRFWSGLTELALEGRARFPVARDREALQLSALLDLRWHPDPAVRLDLEVEVAATLDERDPESLFRVPITFAWSFTHSLFAGVGLGLRVPDARELLLEGRLFVGGTLERAGRPSADLTVEAAMPRLLDGEVLEVVVLASARFYLYAGGP